MPAWAAAAGLNTPDIDVGVIARQLETLVSPATASMVDGVEDVKSLVLDSSEAEDTNDADDAAAKSWKSAAEKNMIR